MSRPFHRAHKACFQAMNPGELVWFLTYVFKRVNYNSLHILGDVVITWCKSQLDIRVRWDGNQGPGTCELTLFESVGDGVKCFLKRSFL